MMAMFAVVVATRTGRIGCPGRHASRKGCYYRHGDGRPHTTAAHSGHHAAVRVQVSGGSTVRMFQLESFGHRLGFGGRRRWRFAQSAPESGERARTVARQAAAATASTSTAAAAVAMATDRFVPLHLADDAHHDSIEAFINTHESKWWNNKIKFFLWREWKDCRQRLGDRVHWLLWMIAFSVGLLIKEITALRESIAWLDNKRGPLRRFTYVATATGRVRTDLFFQLHTSTRRRRRKNAPRWTEDVTTHNFPKVFHGLRFFCLVANGKKE